MANQFTYSISGSTRTSSIRGLSFFDENYTHNTEPPIDKFRAKIKSNIKLLGTSLWNLESEQFVPLANSNSIEWEQISNLVVLGFVSSVESYCRNIIRSLLLIDRESQLSSYKRELTYGAAVFHTSELLPEALLEGVSFHNPWNIKEAFKDFLGLKDFVGNDSQLKAVFEDYKIVAHLRHCVVHRAGLLGSKNAIELGMEQHNTLLEKPLKLDFNSVQEIGFSCENLVKILNDRLLSKTLARTANNISWTGDLRRDKPKFLQYFDLFCPSDENTPERVRDCYREFMNSINA